MGRTKRGGADMLKRAKLLWAGMMLVMMLLMGSSTAALAASGTSFANAITLKRDTYAGGTSTKEGTYYKIVLPTSGCLTVNRQGDYAYMNLYSQNRSMLDSSIYSGDTIHLLAGTYYLRVYYNGASKYSVKYSFVESLETFGESQTSMNNTYSSASQFSLGSTVTGQLAVNDNLDIFRFDFPRSGNLICNISGIYLNCTLVNAFTGENILSGNTNWSQYRTIKQYLTAGSYYLRMETLNSSKGKFTFSTGFEAVTPTSSEGTSVKSADTAKRAVSGSSVKYTVQLIYQNNYVTHVNYTIYNTRQFKPTAKKGRKIKVAWSRVSNASYYEVQYGTRKKLSGGNTKTIKVRGTSKTLKKLKAGKKYYMRVRPVMQANGKTYYGNWTGRMSVKVKK